MYQPIFEAVFQVSLETTHVGYLTSLAVRPGAKPELAVNEQCTVRLARGTL